MEDPKAPAKSGREMQLPAPKPAVKLPRIAKGSKIQRRPLNRQVRTPGSTSNIIYVGRKSSFMAVVKNVRKSLENSPAGVRGQSTKGLPLNARIAALSAGSSGDNDGAGPSSSSSSSSSGVNKHEVVVRGVGRAIEKTLRVAAWFTHERDCKVSLRTMSEATVDDIVKEDGEDDGGFAGEEESRVRMLSCLEVGVQLR